MDTLTAQDMPIGSTVKLTDGYQDIAAGTTGVVVEASMWAVTVEWPWTGRRDFVACRYLTVVRKPTPAAPAAPAPL